MATLQQRETISIASLEAQKGPLGCDASCVVQIMTRLAPAPTGVSPAVVQQMASWNETNNVVGQQTATLNGTNNVVVRQTLK